MKPIRLIPLLLGTGFALFAASCSNTIKANPNQTVVKSAQFVNPYTPGTYNHFKAEKYPGTTRTWKNKELLPRTNPANSRVKIDLTTQRGFLMVGDEVAMDYRISSGSYKRKTPSGSFKILEKTETKRSNLYGRILDAEGNTVNSDADARTDTIPEGGEFLGASMPYWMRLTGTGIGMHQGNVNRRYASHGCIRTHSSATSIVYNKVRIGTPVEVTP